MHGCRICLTLLFALGFAGFAQGQSFGYWHVPSTTAQFFGHGYGAGHHAPIVRSSCTKPPYVPQRVYLSSFQQRCHSFVTAPSVANAYGCISAHSDSMHSQVTFDNPTTTHQPVFRMTTPIFAPPKLPAPTNEEHDTLHTPDKSKNDLDE